MSHINFQVASPKFKTLYEQHRYKVFYSGRATGKSWALAQAAVYFMFTTQVRILSCRMHMNSIRESNHKLVADSIERMGLTEFFEIGQYEIKCKKTSSTMFFKGLFNNFSSLKSIENVGICLVDEAESVTEEAWGYLIPTIRSQWSEVWVSFNPRFVSDATYQRFVVNTPENSIVTKLTIEDNPYVSSEIIKEMEHDKNTNLDRYKWVWCGEPLGSEAMTLITQALITQARVNKPVREVDKAIVAGLDVSGLGADYTVLVRRRGFEILSVDQMHKGDTNAVTNWVKDIYTSRPWDKIVIDASGSTGVYDNIQAWSTVHKQFNTYRFLGGASPTRKDLYTNARTESWVRMRNWLSQGRVTQHKEWDDLCQVQYTFAEREQIKLLSKKDLKKSPDFGDALSQSLWVNDVKLINEPMTPVWQTVTREWHG
jgi:phage terminase large subunit